MAETCNHRLGEWDNQCNWGLGVQLPHSYFTPSFVFILYLYFFNIIEYNLFYIMYTNYITVLYRAKHELHGEIQEKNDMVLCFAKPLLFSLFQETSQDTLNLVGISHLTNSCPKVNLVHHHCALLSLEHWQGWYPKELSHLTSFFLSPFSHKTSSSSFF